MGHLWNAELAASKASLPALPETPSEPNFATFFLDQRLKCSWPGDEILKDNAQDTTVLN